MGQSGSNLADKTVRQERTPRETQNASYRNDISSRAAPPAASAARLVTDADLDRRSDAADHSHPDTFGVRALDPVAASERWSSRAMRRVRHPLYAFGEHGGIMSE